MSQPNTPNDLEDSIETLLSNFVLELPLKTTEIGYEKVGEDLQETRDKLSKLFATQQKKLLNELMEKQAIIIMRSDGTGDWAVVPVSIIEERLKGL